MKNLFFAKPDIGWLHDFADQPSAHKTLASHAKEGMIWLSISQAVKIMALAVSTIVLARIISPEDFGIFAMTATVTSFLSLFRDAGLTNATTQQDKLSAAQVSTLFWINQGISLALAALTFLLSPFIAQFYNAPELAVVICALAIGFPLGGLGAQHDALLRRALCYRQVSAVEISAAILSLIPTFAAAFLGWGYWSLVIQRISHLLFASAGNWHYCSWRPEFIFNWRESAANFNFGAQISAFNFINYFSRNGDNILIGWKLGAAALGFYSKAYDLLTAPLQQIAAPLQSTLLPLLARQREQQDAYRKTYLNSYKPAILLMFPIGTGMFFMPEDIVAVVFGSGWEPAIPVIRWLGICVAIQLAGASTGTLLLSQKRGKDFAVFGMISSPITLCSFAIGLPWGIEGVAKSYALIHMFLWLPVLFYLTGKKGPVSARHIFSLFDLPLRCGALTWPALCLYKQFLTTPWAILNIFCAGLVILICMLAVLCASQEGRIYLRTGLGWLKTTHRKLFSPDESIAGAAP